MIVTLLLLASLSVRNRSGWFCRRAKVSPCKTANPVSHKGHTTFAIVQPNPCKAATSALQNGGTGSLSSKSVIKRSVQRVSSEQSASRLLAVEVAR